MRKLGKTVLLFLMTLAPMSVGQAACQMNNVGGLHISKYENAIFVPVTIDGREVLFQIDTGARKSWLLHAGADAIGAKVLLTTGGRLHENIHFMTARIGAASIGKWTLKDFDINVYDGPANLGLPGAVGVVGQDLLKNFDVEFNVKEGVVNFFIPQDCAESNLAYWSDSFNVVEMLSEANLPKGEPNRIFALAKINGQDALVGFMSGAGQSRLFSDAAERLGVTPSSPGVTRAGDIRVSGGETVPLWRGSFASFSLDQEEIKPAVLAFSDRTVADTGGRKMSHYLVTRRPQRFDMILGADFIAAHRILFSNSQRKIYLTYAGGQPFYVANGMQPVSAADDEDEE